MQQIRGESGKSLDPNVVEILQHEYRTLEQCAQAQASQGPVLSAEIVTAKGAVPDAGLELYALPQDAEANISSGPTLRPQRARSSYCGKPLPSELRWT